MKKFVYNILNKINSKDNDAYLVGGYVRDFLLGKKSYDIDICTNMDVNDIVFLLNNKFVNNNYGGCFCAYKKYNIEITTFRKNEVYNKRKPVSFSKAMNINEDYLRRDFTINAIYMDRLGNIYDPSDGVNDLQNGIIRSVDYREDKFTEDPLRILRAIRFATLYNFVIEDNTLLLMKKSVNSLNTLSVFRIREELDKIFSSKNYLIGLNYINILGIDKILNINWKDIIYTKSLYGMYCQLVIPDKYFNKSELDVIYKLRQLVNIHNIDSFSIFNNGLDLCLTAGKIMGVKCKEIKSIYNKMPIKKMSDINIDGKDIIKVLNINPSRLISDIIGDIKKEILLGNLKNNKKDIINYIRVKWSHEQG